MKKKQPAAHTRVKPNPSQINSNFLGSADITSQEESALLHYMINHIGEELMVIDREGRIVYVNEATVKGLNYSRKYLLNKKITDFFKEKITIAQWKRTHFAELKRKRRPVSYQIERIEKGGRTRVIEVTAVFMPYQGQGLIISIARDITEQLFMQFSLKESEDLYRVICEGAGDVIFMVNLSGHIVYANKEAVKFLKIPIEKLKGKHFEELTHENSLKRARDHFRRAKSNSEQFQVEVDIVDNEGVSIPVEVKVSPITKNGKIVAVHAVVRDIRERKQFEALQSEAERIKAIQYFTSGTAQELNLPLLRVLKEVEDLLKKYKQRNFEYIGFREFMRIMDSIESIGDQVRYCSDTVNRMMSLNKRKFGLGKKTCSINRVINEDFKAKNEQLKNDKISIKLHLASRIPQIALSEIEFSEIFKNVLNNAIQSMPGGGSLSIKTSHIHGSRKVQMVVADTGVGMSKEALKHIFEPFFTTKQRGINLNSGLGLPIVYSLVKACHGDIQVSSSLRKGTTVKITFPIIGKSKK